MCDIGDIIEAITYVRVASLFYSAAAIMMMVTCLSDTLRGSKFGTPPMFFSRALPTTRYSVIFKKGHMHLPVYCFLYSAL